MELTPLQRKVLVAFAQSPLVEHFYWTGGTLLASVYLHHRLSEDLDFFSDTRVSYDAVAPFVAQCRSELQLKTIDERRVHDRWEFWLRNHESVRVEFVWYDFPALKPRKRWQGIPIDSLDDLAANKTMAMMERHAPKDVVDLYFLMTKKGYTPKRFLELAQRKFGLHVPVSLFWSQASLADRELQEATFVFTSEKKQDKKLREDVHQFVTEKSSAFLRSQLY